jgi:hypothetical protein
VSAEDRKRLAEQIAKAKARRTAPPATGGDTSATGPRPELAGQEDATIVRTTMKDAMREIIQYLADCYDKAGIPTSERSSTPTASPTGWVLRSSRRSIRA